ncbi:MAG: hypothetical protein CM15mP111_2180 [Hyphomicrobiales bacterium]|nr:MAG: hypothetical protein CM15mP111_2180 [Hyphomicrobiales bacterium]
MGIGYFHLNHPYLFCELSEVSKFNIQPISIASLNTTG